MKVFSVGAFAAGSVSVVAAAHAAPVNRYYDVASHKWVELGPGGRSTANPIPRQVVAYDGPYGANTIVVVTSERRLYYVQATARRSNTAWASAAKASVGRHEPHHAQGGMAGLDAAAGHAQAPPRSAAHMEGGPNNPLGARAMYIGSTYYRIHGSNEPWTIGQAVSSGCIRMANEDVIHLYEMVKVGTKVVVQN